MSGSYASEFRFWRGSFLWQPAAGFQTGRSGLLNDLRGALGMLLPEQWFRPRWTGGPSGWRDAPSPFLLREEPASPGYLAFAAHLFDPSGREILQQALHQVARAGLGKGRTPCQPLQSCWDWMAVPLTPEHGCRRCRVEFLTPTDIKCLPHGAHCLPFDLLLKRIRDRVSALASFYGCAVLDLDFARLGQRAAAVRKAAAELVWVRRVRRSTRSGQTHLLGGFTGSVEYEGELDEFLPLMRAAAATGVGRHTTWGSGMLRVSAL